MNNNLAAIVQHYKDHKFEVAGPNETSMGSRYWDIIQEDKSIVRVMHDDVDTTVTTMTHNHILVSKTTFYNVQDRIIDLYINLAILGTVEQA